MTSPPMTSPNYPRKAPTGANTELKFFHYSFLLPFRFLKESFIFKGFFCQLEQEFQSVHWPTMCEKFHQLLAVGRWFPPGTPVSSTRQLISSSFHRLDMTLAVAEALNPNKPNHWSTVHMRSVHRELYLYNRGL